jgi:VWFA-related protein
VVVAIFANRRALSCTPRLSEDRAPSHHPMADPRLRILIPSVAGVLAVHLAAQEPRQTQPPIRSGVQAIEVDVRVFDKDGRFVTGLTREDFEVFEDGVAHTVDALFLVGAPATAHAPAGAAIEPTARAPIASAPAAARQTWIFVFDTYHLVPGAGFDRAKQAVTEFLRTRFKEGDVGGIVFNGKMVNNRLTSVREELVAAAGSVKPNADLRSRTLELTREWPRLRDELEAIQISYGDKDSLQRAVMRACSDEPSSCRNVPPDMAVQQKARRFHTEFERDTRNTLSTVAALASGLSKIAGPKTVVLLSDGFVTERMETALQQAVGQTTRAGARVYSIDVAAAGPGSSISRWSTTRSADLRNSTCRPTARTASPSIPAA